MDLRDGYNALAENANKVGSIENDQEGVVSTLVPELELSMSDDELIKLKKMWVKNWEPYNKIIEQLQTENENYWMGNKFCITDDNKQIADNWFLRMAVE